MDPVMLEEFWRFVAARQLMAERRRSGAPPPWTDNPILATHRFTNVYRATDRVSQYLIRDVLYTRGSQAPRELAFRAVLFRIFNLPSTWKTLAAGLYETPSLARFGSITYGHILDAAQERGDKLWNNAYMMCGVPVFGQPQGTHGPAKHHTYLELLRLMARAGVFDRIVEANTMRGVYNELHKWPLVNDFLAMQWTVDINYSTATNFSENEFIVAGPGARRGAAKLGSDDPEQIIRELAVSQDAAFEALGIDFPYLGGSRMLSLMDVQSCLCEFDKYARVAFPSARNGPARIKQRYNPKSAQPLQPLFFPPKWNLEVQ